MSTEIAAVSPPAKPPASPKEKKAPKVQGKLRKALDLMVFGDDEQLVYGAFEAARKVNFTVQAMRKALERNHVRAYLKQQKEVFRESASAQNISRAVQIRDQDENKLAALHAIRYLDGETAKGNGVNVSITNVMTPGIVVDLAPAKDDERIGEQPLIEINPTERTTEPFSSLRETAMNANDDGDAS